MRLRRLCLLLAVVLLVTAVPAAAQEQTGTETQSGDEDDGGISIDLRELIEAIEDLGTDFDSFSDSWDKTLEELLKSVIFGPFKSLLKYLISEIASILLHTPDVYPNPSVEETYQDTLIVTYLLASLAFIAAGLLHMFGPIVGVKYSQVRMILPRLVVGLVFASISLPLLQYMVEFSDVLVYAFKPDGLEASLGEMYGTSATLALVWVINSWLLLAIVLLFVVRAVYILFVAAISPLLALGWSLPKVKRYADTFISGWFTALMMAPLDMIVLRFSFALMTGQGTTPTQSIANWLYGMAAAVLLIWVPYQLYGASQAAVGQAYLIAGGVKKRVKKSRSNQRKESWRNQRRGHRQPGYQGSKKGRGDD